MTELQTLLGKQWVRRNGEIDEKMVEYCLKSSLYIDLGDFYLDIGNSKPTIESTMWYDDETDGPDDSKFEVFRAYNTRGKRLSFEKLIEDGYSEIWIFTHYTRDMTGGRIKSWTASRVGDEPRHVGEVRRATPDEIGAIKQGLAQIRADYEKRLATYWKRYSNKVHASGYWANR